MAWRVEYACVSIMLLGNQGGGEREKDNGIIKHVGTGRGGGGLDDIRTKGNGEGKIYQEKKYIVLFQ